MYTSGAVLWRSVKQTLALFCAFVSGYDIGISSKLFFKSHLFDYNPRVEVCVTSRRRRHHRVHNIYSEAASGHTRMSSYSHVSPTDRPSQRLKSLD